MGHRTWRHVLTVTVLSGAVTVLAAASPALRFGYHAPALHVALETAAALVALVSAFLVFGRLERELRLDDLLLASGLGLLALMNFFFSAVPAITNDPANTFVTSSAVTGRFLGAVLLAAAAFTPRRTLAIRGQTIRTTGVAILALVAATAGAGGIAQAWHPGNLVTVSGGTVSSAAHPDLNAPPALLAVQLVAALLYAAASVGFARRAERTGDRFFHWVAVACVLSTFARVNYFLYPSAYTDWVYLGDAFGMGFFIALLVAALREITSYWESVTVRAALEERRRIARDLHDGLAQEVAFISRNVKLLDGSDGDRELRGRLAAAAERATLESRQVISALSVAPAEPLEGLIARTARDAASRYRAEVDLDLADGVRLDPQRAEALLRITAEAVTNAARHSGETTVAVSLKRAARGLTLRISDRGRGFDTAALATAAGGGERFGLISMSGRASAVGADLRVTSRLYSGTVVEVVF
jgi:signal transduction histidine kinase